MNLQMGFKISCVGQLPQGRKVQAVILVIILLTWLVRAFVLSTAV